MNNEVILIIDDKPNIREVLSDYLKNKGFSVESCENAEIALENIQKILPDLIVTDLKMPGIDGIKLMNEVRNIDPNIPVILITAFGTISSAVEAMKAGAYDYLTKPIDYNRLRILIRRALDQKKISSENKYLKEKLEDKYSLNNLVGKSSAMEKLFTLIKTVSSSNSAVLIQGECGTGKELIAQAIYHNSLRKEKPLVVVDCAALPEGLLESELFGYERGAFTGALCKKKGRLEFAHQGTLFLDEIGEMSPSLQAKLLRVLQEKQFIRLGGLETIKIDFRLIASTNRDLNEEIAKGGFRSDLYYRLNIINIQVPPLRERREDIPLLIERFIDKFSCRDGKRIKTVSPEAMEYMIQYNWPGNVRELENSIERLMVVSESELISAEQLPGEILKTSIVIKEPTKIKQKGYDLKEIEKDMVVKALKDADWNKSKAARLLHIDRTALYNRIKKYGISIPEKNKKQ